MDEAKKHLDAACRFYCEWYDTGKPDISGSAVAYELATWCREALKAMEESDVKSTP